MNGSDYVAVVGLYEKGEMVAAPGERCTRVAECSLSWLAEQGLIVPAPKADTAARKRAKE